MDAARVILLVEDSPVQVAMVQGLLRDLGGHRTVVAETAAQGFEAALRERPDVVLLDLELPDGSGFGLMRRLREEGIDAAVIVITANASIGTAVEAMREGATDFVVKPFAKARLLVTLQNALDRRALASELKQAKAQLSRDRFYGFIGASPAMQAVYRTIESVAPSRANVFITGQSGTGKELAAEAIHRASPRRGKGFVALNCGAIPRDLLESEIFGHVKGAFTGATDTRLGAAKMADGGTLFLDEIGEMPLEMQVKLLRFVQTGTFQPVGASRPEKVDVRLVSATNRDPWAEVEAGRFREDLYYRLYVVPIEMPPLRDRGEDVLLVARHFLARYAKEEGRRFRGFAPETEAVLRRYPWPGNVRQLQNVVRNIVVLHDSERVEPAMLPPMLLRLGAAAAAAPVSRQESAAGETAPTLPPEKPASSPALPPERPVSSPAPPPDEGEASPGPALDEGEASPGPGFGAAETSRVGATFEEREMPRERDRAPSPSWTEAAAAEPPPPSTAAPPPPEGVPEDVWRFEPTSMRVLERRAILAALLRTNHDVPRAAAILEVNPSTIYRRLIAWREDGTLPPIWRR